MALKIGIVGLPNVGKSTLFNILTKKQVEIANYPFTTIEPNVAVVPVPDENLEKLAEIIKPKKITPATIEFIDVAGLVKDAYLGKGLGNKFLAKIRETNALVEVVRVFENEEVSHTEGKVDPGRDIEIINFELKQAGIEKPMVYVFNVSLNSSWPEVEKNYAGLAMPLKEELDISSSSLVEKLIGICYELLELITFYTIKGGEEIRATKLKRGEDILEAAAKIHGDFAGKFIRAEVISCDDLLSSGGWFQSKQRGLVRTEGKQYIVQDGDVVEFKI